MSIQEEECYKCGYKGPVKDIHPDHLEDFKTLYVYSLAENQFICYNCLQRIEEENPAQSFEGIELEGPKDRTLGVYHYSNGGIGLFKFKSFDRLQITLLHEIIHHVLHREIDFKTCCDFDRLKTYDLLKEIS